MRSGLALDNGSSVSLIEPLHSGARERSTAAACRKAIHHNTMESRRNKLHPSSQLSYGLIGLQVVRPHDLKDTEQK